MTEIESRYRKATAEDMGLDVDVFEASQTLLLPEKERAGSSMVVAYHIGQLVGLRCDPALEQDLAGLLEANASGDITFNKIGVWAEAAGWEYVDGGDTHLLLDGLRPRGLPSDAELVMLSRDVDADRLKMASLLESSDPDDVDASEFEMDELDPFLLGLLDADGHLGALVGGREWEEDPTFDDIGVLVRTDLRGNGWGAAVVSALCQASTERGRIPLYRCNWSRGPSKATALTLGFKQVGTLLAYRRPTAT